MTDKVKRDEVSSEMQKRLYANRDGRLFTSQWIDLATEPLVILLLLTTPAMVILGPRLATLLRLWWLALILIFVLYVVPVLLRAFRYARAPIHFTRLYGGTRTHGCMLWKTPEFQTAEETPVRFKSRLAPSVPLIPDREYLVYYLDEPGGKVLLSFAPSDHEDAALWLPNKNFDKRFARRTGKPRTT